MNDDVPVLELERASYWRGERVILHAIDWRIRKGEHWALLGANGSGKTTLLRMVGAVDWPCDGTIRVLGRRFGEIDLRELRRSIGLVTSALGAYFHERQSALEIVATGIDAELGWWRTFGADDQARARIALDEVGILSLAVSPYVQLSQGERQRVLIARAMITRPTLLILDEPCAGLDPSARENFLDDLAAFARRPETPTLIFVSHHIEEIPSFIERALVLKDGRALAQGPIADVCTSDVLSAAFDRPCRVARRADDGRFVLQVQARPHARPHPGTPEPCRCSQWSLPHRSPAFPFAWLCRPMFATRPTRLSSPIAAWPPGCWSMNPSRWAPTAWWTCTAAVPLSRASPSTISRVRAWCGDSSSGSRHPPTRAGHIEGSARCGETSHASREVCAVSAAVRARSCWNWDRRCRPRGS
jgi:iron complex transport system ATP-binding protein